MTTCAPECNRYHRPDEPCNDYGVLPSPSRGDETTPGVGRGGGEGDDA